MSSLPFAKNATFGLNFYTSGNIWQKFQRHVTKFLLGITVYNNVIEMTCLVSLTQQHKEKEHFLRRPVSLRYG